ncbi:MAG: hypothetical protein KAH96_00915, partial [Alphaproteobacteria bacterium]|nr:hypothetical protein [Alphaproteobacteria bacterium]
RPTEPFTCNTGKKAERCSQTFLSATAREAVLAFIFGCDERDRVTLSDIVAACATTGKQNIINTNRKNLINFPNTAETPPNGF